jgi:branched-chain amino acid transport system permease protein
LPVRIRRGSGSDRSRLNSALRIRILRGRVTTDASLLSRLVRRRPTIVETLGLALVGVVVVWLAVNLEKTPTLWAEVGLVGITNGCIYALVALGYSLVYGILELINFAHGDVFMLGGMFSITVATSLGLQAGAADLWPLIVVCLLASMACCAVINAAIEFVAYRPLRNATRLAPLITAIGMSFIIEDVGLIWKGPSYVTFPNVLPSTNLFSIGSVGVPWTTPIVVVLTVPVLLVLLWLVQRTKQGKAMRATAQDMEASAIMGINVNRTISFTFLIAGALAGAAGLVYAVAETTVRYDQGFTLGLIAFTAAVFGGIGNLPGAVLGALLIGLIQAFNEGLTWHAPGSNWTESIVFTILIMILVFRPEGLLGERTPEGG